MGKRFGARFDHVRIHADALAGESAAAVDADAFTVSSDLVFARGRYAPQTRAGRRLIAHELAHVLQQAGSRTGMAGPLRVDASGEAEASRAADAVMSGGSPIARGSTAATIQRESVDPDPNDASGVGPLAGVASLASLGGLGLGGLIPTTTPCRPASSRAQCEVMWTFVIGSWIPFARTAFGADVESLWLEYLNRGSSSIPRPARRFSGSATPVVRGFSSHHRSAEAEREIVAAAGTALRGPAASLMPAPSTSSVVPVTTVIPPATLATRIGDRTGADPMSLEYDSPATTIAGNIAGGIGDGGPPGGTTLDPDTRGVDGSLGLTLDAAGTNLTVAPAVTFHVHDTVDFCPGALGGLAARAETVPMSILEATEGRFGPVFAADVPFDVDYPGPGTSATTVTVTPPAPVPPPPTPPPPTPTPFPRTGPAKTTGTLLRIRTGPGLTFTVLRLIERKGTPITVLDQRHGDPVDGNDVWDRIAEGWVSDHYVAFDPPTGITGSPGSTGLPGSP